MASHRSPVRCGKIRSDDRHRARSDTAGLPGPFHWATVVALITQFVLGYSLTAGVGEGVDADAAASPGAGGVVVATCRSARTRC